MILRVACQVVLRPCDTDTYLQNIIFSYISEIFFMCITDGFNLFSCSSATLKMIDKLEKAHMSFLRIIHCHDGIGYEEKVEE